MTDEGAALIAALFLLNPKTPEEWKETINKVEHLKVGEPTMPLRADEVVSSGTEISNAVPMKWSVKALGNRYYILEPIAPHPEYIIKGEEFNWTFKRAVELTLLILNQTDNAGAGQTATIGLILGLEDFQAASSIRYLTLEDTAYSWLEKFGEGYIIPPDRTLTLDFASGTANYRLKVKMIVRVLDET